ncbi:MAG: sulfatase-like hydrolase/transferase [Eubacteriales bacterium]|nr:sulfatase-like hydrolase/transferase [Eubacteriales bacterium]
MDTAPSKYAARRTRSAFFLLPGSLYLVEVFAFFFLSLNTGNFSMAQLWPLAFGALWAVCLGCLLRVLPRLAARLVYGIAYFGKLVYAGFQTGYYILFSEMMWLSDFRYTSEGTDYADILLTYPVFWWVGLALLIGLGVFLLVRFPRWERSLGRSVLSGLLAAAMAAGTLCLPQAVFYHDRTIRYAGSDYGRMQSAEAAYENMFNAHRLYQVCGLTQTFFKDLSAHVLYPLTPGYAREQEQAREEIGQAFAQQPQRQDNEMTGLLKGKNVVLVLMESMDDWMITEDTPYLNRLMSEGINFTSFYTPVYGGIRTFNTEFAINTGSFLKSAGGYAFDYVTNAYSQSLASLLRREGYSAKTFHYNDPTFYSRGVFSEAMGYESYVCYADFVPEGKEKKNKLYDDQLLFDNEGLRQEFFRQGQPTLNFVITRSAHLSYKYNEVLSHWALKRFPEYRGFTGSEENDCALVKARLVDEFFGRMIRELEVQGQLDNTVIVGVTDHYTYGYKNEKELLHLSGVEEKLLLEKTPAFIWSPGLEPMEVTKVLNTSDLLPTLLNLLDVDYGYDYIGSDAFDSRYEGFVPFSNGSWIAGDIAYDAASGRYISISGAQVNVTQAFKAEMDEKVKQFVRTNNLILDTDYYKE